MNYADNYQIHKAWTERLNQEFRADVNNMSSDHYNDQIDSLMSKSRLERQQLEKDMSELKDIASDCASTLTQIKN